MCRLWKILVLFLSSLPCSTAAVAHAVAEFDRTFYEAQRGTLIQVGPRELKSTCSNLFRDLLAGNSSLQGAVKALDSFGKPGSGLLAGNWAWFGHFSECSHLEDFKYCLLLLNVDTADLQAELSDDFYLDTVPIQWGVCPPKQCTPDEVQDGVYELLDWLEQSYPTLNMTAVSATVSCVNSPVVPYGVGFYITMAICGLLGILMIIGSLIDVLESRTKEVPAALEAQLESVLNGNANGNVNKGFDEGSVLETNITDSKMEKEQTISHVQNGQANGEATGHSYQANGVSVISPVEHETKEGLDIASVQLATHPNLKANGEASMEVSEAPEVQQFSQVKDGQKKGKKWALQVASGLRLICLDFAFNRNLAKLTKINKSNGRSIDCLNGIRVISMLWVILGHVYYFPAVYGGIFNKIDPYGWLDNIFFQTILNAYFSVDTFFFLSGLLICYLTLQKMEKTKGRIPWALVYVHRYLRLTPVLIAAMAVWMYIVPYTMWGPKADMIAQRPNCPKYWWVNLLYIQNFYPPEFGHACIHWTWYLANDMQFFVISPLIIYALYRKPYIGFGLIGALLGMSFAVTGALVAYFNFPASPTGGLIDPSSKTEVSYNNVIYQKPYVRIPPYLVGMILGYMLYKLKDRRLPLNWVHLVVGWTVSSVIAIATLYGLYGDINDRPLSEASIIVYQMFSRFAWAVFLSWVVLVCQFKKSGWINSFLSWNGWIPLCRLNYTAYLLHPMVIRTFIGNNGLPFYASHWLLVYNFFGVTVITYGCGMILALAIEFPFANMEKHLMPKP